MSKMGKAMAVAKADPMVAEFVRAFYWKTHSKTRDAREHFRLKSLDISTKLSLEQNELAEKALAELQRR